MGEEHLFSLVEMEAGLLGKNAGMEVGFLGKNGDRYMNDFPYPVTSPPPPPPRSGFFEDPFYEQPRYFPHACFLCNKPLGQNMDIFMYRGDTPFCREECRQGQIGIDEAMERNQILSLRVPPSNPSSTFQDKFCDFLQRVGSHPFLVEKKGSKRKFREIPTNTYIHKSGRIAYQSFGVINFFRLWVQDKRREVSCRMRLV